MHVGFIPGCGQMELFTFLKILSFSDIPSPATGFGWVFRDWCIAVKGCIPGVAHRRKGMAEEESGRAGVFLTEGQEIHIGRRYQRKPMVETDICCLPQAVLLWIWIAVVKNGNVTDDFRPGQNEVSSCCVCR